MKIQIMLRKAKKLSILITLMQTSVPKSLHVYTQKHV